MWGDKLSSEEEDSEEDSDGSHDAIVDLEDEEGEQEEEGPRDEIIRDEEDLPDHHETYNSIEEEREANAARKAASRLAKEEQEEGDISSDDEKAKGKKKEKEKEEDYFDLLKKKQAEQEEKRQLEFQDVPQEERDMLLGLPTGVYCRIVLKEVPASFIRLARPEIPVIVGGLLESEEMLGMIRVRIKKHRWHRRILKSNDPLIISYGWRRFQTMPVYAMEDSNKRLRMVKYTPEYMHCQADFYGPAVPPNTGLLAIQKLTSNTPEFRIAATGTVLEQSEHFRIVKKLKLVG